MSASVLSPAAFIITWTMGPIQLACVLGFFLLRHHTVFAIRVPKVVLGCMLTKFLSFCGYAYMYYDPHCPCLVAVMIFWVDWTGNCCNVLRKVVLLFRYEIQAALELNKHAEGNVVALDEQNLFVRYRYVLRQKSQLMIMFFVFVYVGIGMFVILGLFNEYANRPCLTDHILYNPLYAGTVIVSWATFFPMMAFSAWSTRRLKKFPHDNWKMGVESSFTSGFAVLSGIVCIIILATLPTFEYIMFILFSFSIVMQLLNFLMPLQLHRKTVAQLAKMDLKHLTSLHRLLQNEDFLAAFDAFLRKEFSSETLFFWQEVNKIQQKYRGLLPSEYGPEHSSLSNTPSQKSPSQKGSSRNLRPAKEEMPEERLKLLMAAAHECVHLGQQCIGDSAPWQINISGFTGQDMERAIEDLNSLLTQNDPSSIENELKALVEEALKTLVTAQREVYEGLRRDPYPRFMASAAATELNKNENFKRLLAAEKLQDEVSKTTGTPVKGQASQTLDKSEGGKSTARSRTSFEVTLPRQPTGYFGAPKESGRSYGEPPNRSYGEPPSKGGSRAEGGSFMDDGPDEPGTPRGAPTTLLVPAVVTRRRSTSGVEMSAVPAIAEAKTTPRGSQSETNHTPAPSTPRISSTAPAQNAEATPARTSASNDVNSSPLLHSTSVPPISPSPFPSTSPFVFLSPPRASTSAVESSPTVSVDTGAAITVDTSTPLSSTFVSVEPVATSSVRPSASPTSVSWTVVDTPSPVEPSASGIPDPSPP